MTSITSDELRAEICPRICAQELMHLSGLSSLAFATAPSSAHKVLTIDIRSREEFLKGTFPASINIPHASAFGEKGFTLPTHGAVAERLDAHKGRLIVVVGSRASSAAEVRFFTLPDRLEWRLGLVRRAVGAQGLSARVHFARRRQCVQACAYGYSHGAAEQCLICDGLSTRM